MTSTINWIGVAEFLPLLLICGCSLAIDIREAKRRVCIHWDQGYYMLLAFH